VLNTPFTNDVPPTNQQVSVADPLAVACPTELSPSERHHLEMMDAFRHLKMLNTNYQAANRASAAQEAARHDTHTQLVHSSIDGLINLLCKV